MDIRCPRCFFDDADAKGIPIGWMAGRVGEIEAEIGRCACVFPKGDAKPTSECFYHQIERRRGELEIARLRTALEDLLDWAEHPEGRARLRMIPALDGARHALAPYRPETEAQA